MCVCVCVCENAWVKVIKIKSITLFKKEILP